MEKITIDQHTASLCQKLSTIKKGLVELGIHASLLDQVIDKLEKQSRTIAEFKGRPVYEAGYSDGWSAAFNTGLVETVQEELKVGDRCEYSGYSVDIIDIEINPQYGPTYKCVKSMPMKNGTIDIFRYLNRNPKPFWVERQFLTKIS